MVLVSFCGSDQLYYAGKAICLYVNHDLPFLDYPLLVIELPMLL